MTEQGVVLSVNDKFAKVRVGRNSACASCGKCGMTEKQKHVDFFASNSAGAKEGDTVVLDIPDTNSARLAFIGYIIPLIPAIALLFTALGLKWKEWSAALMFLGGLVLGFAVVAIIDRVRHHKWMESPVIVEIVGSRNALKSTPDKIDDETVTQENNEEFDEKGDN